MRPPCKRSLIQTKKGKVRNVGVIFAFKKNFCRVPNPPPTYTDDAVTDDAYAVTFFLSSSQPSPTNVQQAVSSIPTCSVTSRIHFDQELTCRHSKVWSVVPGSGRRITFTSRCQCSPPYKSEKLAKSCTFRCNLRRTS